MKSTLRALGLGFALVVAFYSSAEAAPVTCFYACFGAPGSYSTSTSYASCCLGAPGNFPCPGGGQGIPYAYYSPSGLRTFCPPQP